MKKRICTIITSVLLVCILIASNAYAESNKKVVLFVTNTMNYKELTDMTSVKKLIDTGAIGLMNTRTAGKSDVYKSYATIGSGTRATASYNTAKSFVIDDNIKGIYKRRTGIELNNSGIVNVDMARLINLNTKGEYGAVSGSIGKALHENGKKTAVIGNGDIEDSYIRTGSLIAMDENGYIDEGYIEADILVDDNEYPFGMKTNYEFLVSKFKSLYNRNDFIVIDLQDMARLEKYKVNLSEQMYENMNKQILRDIDLFISDCLKEINLENTRLILVNPYAKTIDIKNGNKLTPLIMVGEGIERGILTSSTTRREGIIGNVDIAPSIIEYFGIHPEKMSGHSLETIGHNDNLNYLKKLNNKTIAVSEQRYPVLSGFAIFEIFVSIIALMMILLRKKINTSIFYFFANILLSTMAVPFVLLIIPLFGTQNLFVTYTLLIVITIGLTYIVKKIASNRIDCVLILSFITVLGLTMDLCTGANLIKTSLLGYDPIIGARYYGIGNEFMGVFIGATLVFTTAMLDRFKISPIFSIIIFFIITFVMGYPRLGANVGGMITAVGAFIFASLRLFRIKIKLKHMVVIGISIVCVVGVMGFIDMRLGGGQSHLAGAILKIANGGPAEIFRIIERKISMNIRIIGITIWSKVLISTIMILAILFYSPVGTISKLSKIYPNLTMGWSSIIFACFVTFFVNDSGVVAAATGIIFLGMSILYLIFFMKGYSE